jgi:hypothetical protein
MQQTDENMDDLFRKAAEQYPLKLDESDWDSVLNRLSTTKEINVTSTKNKRWLLLLLLLLPIGWVYVYYSFSDHGKQQSSNHSLLHQTIIGNDKQAGNNNDVLSTQKNNTQNSLAASIIISNKNISKQYLSNKQPIPVLIDNQYPFLFSMKEQKPVQAANPVEADSVQQTAASTFSTPVLSQQIINQSVEAKQIDNKEIINNVLTSADSNQTKSSSGTIIAAKSMRQVGWYASLISGPDLSSVKLQRIDKFGYNIGLLLGYRFKNNFSIEAGAIWAHKKYYSDGEYFNKTKTGIPANVTILSLDGGCSMFEFPLDIRYDFKATKKGSLFGTVGSSSYIMKNENYNYWAQTNYMPPYTSNKSYINTSNNYFSVLNLSIGYEHSLGKQGNLRVEPYVKLPLNGLGIGNLPISSVGIYIGFTHYFHK